MSLACAHLSCNITDSGVDRDDFQLSLALLLLVFELFKMSLVFYCFGTPDIYTHTRTYIYVFAAKERERIIMEIFSTESTIM